LLQLSPEPASARVSAESEYSKAQTYSAALRLLRVDKGFEVVERDAEAAYLIFAYPDPGQKDSASTGTIEVVQLRDRVKVIVQLPKLPEYHEQLISDALLSKLRRDYGAPPRSKPTPRNPSEKTPEKEKKKKPEEQDEPEQG
jgi:hypothetical protein